MGTNSSEQDVTFFCPVSQVTLNNVEVCSENISTLKKTLEVKGTLAVGSLQPSHASCRE